MPTNTQFALAVHLLIMLALPDAGCLSSDEMARSTATNPVSIRRVLTRFRAAGYVRSRPGTGGGSQLAVDPAQLTLADVWRVVHGDAPVFGFHETSPDCPVGSGVLPMLLGIDDRARRALEDELARMTIAELASEIATPPLSAAVS